MSQADLLIEAVRALDSAGVGYLLSGSLASSIQGEPRATHDIDLVVEVDPRRGMFNLIDVSSGDKLDFWVLTEEPFDRSRFARRVAVEVFGITVAVSAPEDTILQKLVWSAKSGGSERQLRDAAGVYEVQAGTLDEPYLDRWARELGVEDSLAAVRAATMEGGRPFGA